MQIKTAFFLTLLCSSVYLPAQEKSIRYSGNIAAGFLAGQSPTALQLQAVNGVRYKTWSAGLGAGLDYYHTRSVPLFLQIRKAASAKPQTAFIYLNGGFNLPWAKDDETIFVSGYRRGYYGEGGIGYELPVLKKIRFFFGGGWQVKSFTAKMNTMPYLSVWPAPPHAFRDYRHTLSTLTVKGGLRF